MTLISKSKEWFAANNNKLIFILCAIFIVKGIFYAAFVIPLTMFTTPDDVGHLSYIQYIASQRRLPVHGQAYLEISLIEAQDRYINYGEIIDFTIGEETFGTRRNWIVQHPPLYYILMAGVYSFSSLFTRQFSTILLVLRLANLAFGVASLIYLHKILSELNAKDVVRKCVLVFFVFSPALQFYFSAITNDSMLIFVCIFALYYLLKYMNTNRLKHFVIFVVGSALIFGTKYNGFMVMFAYVFFFLYYSLRYNGLRETIKLSLIGVPIGLAIILPDILFNYFQAGRAITNDGGLITGAGAQRAHQITFSHFLFGTHYFSEVTRHIMVLIGWASWVTPDILVERLFAIILIAMTGVHFIKCRNKVNASLTLLIGGVTFALFRYATPIEFSIGVVAVMSCGFMLICFYAVKATELDGREKDIQVFFIATLLITFGVYMYTHYGLFQMHGWARGLHGRYYYIAFLPFAYLLFNQLGEVRSKAVKLAPVALILVLSIVEFHTISMTLNSW